MHRILNAFTYIRVYVNIRIFTVHTSITYLHRNHPLQTSVSPVHKEYVVSGCKVSDISRKCRVRIYTGKQNIPTNIPWFFAAHSGNSLTEVFNTGHDPFLTQIFQFIR